MNEAAQGALLEVLMGREKIGVVHVWRGQGDHSWPLYPGLYRRLLNVHSKDKITESLVEEYEVDMLCEANGLGYYTSNRLDTLVQIQHYGGATRLLDVTRDPLIALWFATAPAHGSNDGAVFHFEVPIEGHIDDADLGSSLDIVTDRAKAVGAALFFPRSEEPRIAAQRAGFLMASIPKTLTDAGPYMENVQGLKVRKVLIPQAMKELLRRHLGASEGVSARSLFPGMAGYAMDNEVGMPYLRSYDKLHDGVDGVFPGRSST